jgi:membrane-associated phospholipid phosphatase
MSSYRRDPLVACDERDGDLRVDLPTSSPFRWSLLATSLRRPYRVTLPMVLLVLLVPFYLVVPQLSGRAPQTPDLPLDHRIPQQPGWVLVYGSLYLFLILLPLFVVREDDAIRRTLFAYLAVWITAYVCFFFYPTVAPRSDDRVVGDGFAAWSLRFLYASDPPYNCFPSLHVAHSFVSAFASYRVHRGLGIAAAGGAFLVGISTLFTRQHYVLDVVSGIGLAAVAAAVFLRGVGREDVPELDRRAAPALAVIVAAIVLLCLGCYRVLYALGFEP